MRKHSTRYTEHELAAWFEVAPDFVVGWIEELNLIADRDELGYTISNLQAATFEDEYTPKIEAARKLRAVTQAMGVARATLRRAEREGIASESDGDGDAS